MNNYTGTKIIGHCGVDSGQILLIDPCYVYQDRFDPEADPSGGDYDECCRITLSDEKAGPTSNLGVVTSTAWGDGAYPVSAYYKNGRIMSITIDFDPPEEGEEDDWDDDEEWDEDDPY